jgi:GAF domain-containing protein/HAMP domain-containing protein
MNPLQRLWAWLKVGHIIRRAITALVLVILPMIIGIVYLVSHQATHLLQQESLAKLETRNRFTADSAEDWLNFNALALQQMAEQEEIWQMDAVEQTRALQKMAALHPYMYLVSTTDINGLNVARSDGQPNKDYSSREWFTAVKAGAQFFYQPLLGATSGQPALVVSTPIKDDQLRLVGVAMFAIDLKTVSQLVDVESFGATGITYVVDDKNHVVFHPDSAIIAQMLDVSDDQAVKKLRQGYDGVIHFVDQNGVSWLASVTLLQNGWGVISQQQEQENFAAIRDAQRTGTIVTMSGAAIVIIVFFLVSRTVLRPISDLTEVASSIAKGDFHRRAKIESTDELGILARSFNEMADQLQATQTHLEQQVAVRTSELQVRGSQLEAIAAELRANTIELDERSSYLQTIADVNRIVATILDPEELMRQVVELIRERFNLYYVGLFLVDAARQNAWLRAGTGQMGQNMLQRKHFIPVGAGMIGWTIEHAEPRIALQAGEDEVRLASPDLPDTRSEAALPLRSRDVVIGALSIQSSIADDFTDENITLYQTLADQVAVALDNARLYHQSQEALQSLREAYGQQSAETWQRMLRTRTDLAYRSDSRGVEKAPDIWYPEMDTALKQGSLVTETTPEDDTGADAVHPLAIPIKVRGQVVGVFDARRELERGTWLPEDITLMQTVVEQLGVAIESAQLYQETQNRAERERMVAEITGKLRASNDPKEILQTAAAELRRALHAKDAHVLLRGASAAKGGGDEIGVQEQKP